MYHYVRPDQIDYPNFNNLDVEKFKKQLDYFESNYGFISKDDYIEAIKNNKNLDGVVLTFDDGFKDHYNYVLPELNKKGIWGIFYLSTGVYSTKKLLGVHRTHYLKGKYGASFILDEVLGLINDNMLDHETIEKFDSDIYTHTSYEEDEKQLRRLFNYYIKYEYRDDILNTLMDRFFNEQKLFEEVYLSISEIEELNNSGNMIGSHTVSHKVLSRLTYDEQYSEINHAINFIDKIVRQDYKSFAYPYGYDSSYNANTLKVLNELDVDDACIFDNRVQERDIKQYELSRIDCNQFMDV